MSDSSLERHIGAIFGLRGATYQFLDIPVNDVLVVTTLTERFALKLYHQGRTAGSVQWEVDLVRHLAANGAPVARPVAGRGAYVHEVPLRGVKRVAVLFEWAPGVKPSPGSDTYFLLGQAAGAVHRAADTFRSALPRERYDVSVLIDEQLQRMTEHLTAAGVKQRVTRLADRLKAAITDDELDTGVCHMDLNLDNVHRIGERLTVFDFDSAGKCWRAVEPYGVLRLSRSYFQNWLDGYRSVRPFARRDEAAVTAFTVIGDLRAVAWKLGVAESSRGAPALGVPDLPGIVDEWEERSD